MKALNQTVIILIVLAALGLLSTVYAQKSLDRLGEHTTQMQMTPAATPTGSVEPGSDYYFPSQFEIKAEDDYPVEPPPTF